MSDPSSVPPVVAEIADEFVELLRRGESPRVSDYEARYPELATIIREVLPGLEVMERLKPSGSVCTRQISEELPDGTGWPAQLGEFSIIREIGRGGMGVVYEAIQQSLGRRVALKVLPNKAIDDPTRLARFDREARAAARLHHTNIVPVYDFGVSDGMHYFAMQYINGLGLDEVLVEIKRARHLLPLDETTDFDLNSSPAEEQRGKSESIAETLLGTTLRYVPENLSANETLRTQLADTIRDSSAASIADSQSGRTGLRTQRYNQNIAGLGIQAARALDYAHQQGVLHRDIKPSNLVLDTHNTIWVTDFGLAVTDEDEGLTKTGEVLGTLRYMAPEVFGGKADRRSDIYSLGITLYEMLALRPAFDDRDRRQLVRRILNEAPTRLRTIDPLISRDLETIVQKAIDREPGRRYPTAGAFADDLQRFLNGEPIRARRQSWALHFSRWVKRNPLSAALAGAVMLLLMATAVISSIAAWNLNRIAAERTSALITANANHARAEALAVKESTAREEAESSLRRAERIEKFMVRALRSPSPEFDGRKVTIYQVLKRTLDEIDQELGDDPKVQLHALLSIHDAFNGLDQVNDALEVIKKADGLAAKVYPEMDYQRLITRHLLGTTLRRAGRLEESEQILQQTYDDCVKTLGQGDELTITVADELGIAWLELGREKEAVELFDRNFEIANKSLGPTHRLTLEGLHNLAARYQSIQKPELAIPIYQRALDLRTKHLGELAQGTLISRVNLGGAMRDAHQTQAALELLTEALPLCRENLGDDHSTTLVCLNNLGMAQADSGDFQGAIDTLRQVEERRIASKDASHPGVISVQTNLAGLYLHVGNPEEGIAYLEKARKSSLEVLGPDHWRTLKIGSELAMACQKAGNISGAIDIVDEVLERKTTIDREDPLEVVIAMTNLGTILCQEGQTERALALFESGLPPTEDRFGKTSRQARNLIRWIHMCLVSQQNWPQAIENMAAWERCLDADKTASASEKNWLNINLAYAFLKTGSVGDAKPLIGPAVQAYRENEPNGLMFPWARHTQGLLLAASGELDQAQEMLVESAEVLIALAETAPKHFKFRRRWPSKTWFGFSKRLTPTRNKSRIGNSD